MAVEKVVVFNAHGGSNTKGAAINDWLRAIDVDVAFISELKRLADDLRAGRLYTGKPAMGRGANDTAILLRSGRASYFRQHQLTRDVPWNDEHPGWSHDRWFTHVRKDNTAYFAVHGNAVIQKDGEWLSNPGADEWRCEGLPKLYNAISRAKRRGRDVQIGGDFNFPASSTKWSPNWMFDQLGLRYIHHNVDWFAWDPEVWRTTHHSIGRIAPGADAHKSIQVHLARRAR
jgi:hypothetical protein